MIFCFSEDITFNHAPITQHPGIYTNGLIECVVDGKPKPEVSFRRNGKKIMTGKILRGKKSSRKIYIKIIRIIKRNVFVKVMLKRSCLGEIVGFIIHY